VNLLAVVEKAIASDLLASSLVVLPESGASVDLVVDLEETLGFPLSPGYKEFLARWNGANLDVVRVHGIASGSSGIPSAWPFTSYAVAGLVVASDPSGFIYVEAPDHTIHVVDHDGGAKRVIAPDFSAFMTQVVFGSGARHFLGEEWFRELKSRGFV